MISPSRSLAILVTVLYGIAWSHTLEFIRHQVAVEMMVVDYVNKMSGDQGAGTSIESAESEASTSGIAEVPSPVATEPSTTIDPATEPSGTTEPSTETPAAMEQPKTARMCDLDDNLKLAFCYQFLATEFYQFDFKLLEGDWKLDCKPRKILLRVLDQSELHTPSQSVDCFQCPSIVEAPLLEQADTYFVSDALLERGAIVYAQKNAYSPIHPQVLVLQINTQELAWVTVKRAKEEFFDTRAPRHEKGEQNLLPAVLETNDLRDLQSPYQKFAQGYFIFNLCGLSKMEKVFACQQYVHRVEGSLADIEFDEVTYRGYGCRRYKVVLDRTEAPFVYANDVAQFRCPAIVHYKHEGSGATLKKFFEPSVRLLSVQRQPLAALFSRLRESSHITLEATVEGLSLKDVQSVHSLRRYMSPPRGQVATLPHDVHRRRARSYKMARIIDFNRDNAERALAASRGFKTIPVYERLQHTHSKINMSNLTSVHTMNLCKMVFGNQAFGFEIINASERIVKKKFEYYVNKLEGLEDGTNHPQNVACIECFPSSPIIYENLFLAGQIEDDRILVLVRGYGSKLVTPLAVTDPIQLTDIELQ